MQGRKASRHRRGGENVAKIVAFRNKHMMKSSEEQCLVR